MHITVNGSVREIPERSTIQMLLAEFALVDQKVAVECNGQIVARDQFAKQMLCEGDVLEIVRFVGGG